MALSVFVFFGGGGGGHCGSHPPSSCQRHTPHLVALSSLAQGPPHSGHVPVARRWDYLQTGLQGYPCSCPSAPEGRPRTHELQTRHSVWTTFNNAEQHPPQLPGLESQPPNNFSPVSAAICFRKCCASLNGAIHNPQMSIHHWTHRSCLPLPSMEPNSLTRQRSLVVHALRPRRGLRETCPSTQVSGVACNVLAAPHKPF